MFSAAGDLMELHPDEVPLAIEKLSNEGALGLRSFGDLPQSVLTNLAACVLPNDAD